MDNTTTDTYSSNKAILLLVGGGLLVGLAIGLILFTRLNSDQDASKTAAEALEVEVAPAIGFLAPDFSLTNIWTGEAITLRELQGQPVIINFWATWCGPCRIEMPAIQAAYDRHQADNLVVLAVNFDEPPEAVSAFGESLNLSFPILLDPGGEIQKVYRVRAYPSTFFIAPDGIVTSLQLGLMTEGQLAEHIEKIVP